MHSHVSRSRYLRFFTAAVAGLGLMTSAHAVTYNWTPTTAGTFNWDDATSNWTSGFPNAVGDIANLTANLAGAQTINLNQGITLGSLTIGDPSTAFFAYTIAAGTAGSLTLNNDGTGASLTTSNVAAGVTNVISAPVYFADNVTANVQSTDALSISGVIADSAGAHGLAKTGSGNLLLSALNTFSGGVTLTAGTLTLAGVGTGTSGVPTAGALGTGLFTVNGNSTLTESAATTIYNNIVVNPGITLSVNSNTANIALAGNISGGGTISQSGTNTGGTHLNGNNSSFTGVFTTANNSSNRIRFNNVNAGSANATWILNNAAADGHGLAFGTGTLSFGALSGNGVFRNDSAGTATISIGALNTSTTWGGQFIANGGNIIAVAKTGTGTLTMTNTNAYTGATTVNNGTLRVTGNLSGTGSVVVNTGGTFFNSNLAGVAATTYTVNSGGTLLNSGTLTGTTMAVNGGATFGGNGTFGGTVTIAGGADATTRGKIGLADGTVGTMTLGNLNVGDSGTGASMITVDANATTSDLINLNSGTFTVNAGGAIINVAGLGVVTASQTYNLINFGTGAGAGFATGSGATVGALSVVNPFGVTGHLNVTSNQVQYIPDGVTAAPATAYWSGAQGSQWNSLNGSSTAGNFTTDQAGTNFVSQHPGATTDVIFAANGATNLSNSLGQSFDIKSVTFQSGVGAVSISGASQNLQIEGGGITVQSGSGGATISTGTVTLGSDQTWTNNGANPLVVTSVISGTTSLTLAGTGKVNLGGTSLTAAGLNINAVLDVKGTPVSSGTLVGAGTITNSGASTTLTANSATDSTFSGNISDGGAGSVITFVKNGTSTLLLSGNNTYAGTTTVSGGTLKAGSASAISTGLASVANGATFDLNGQTLANNFGDNSTIDGFAGTGASGGALVNSSTTTAQITGNIFTNQAWTVGGTGNIVLSGILNRRNNLSNGITMGGTGTLTITGTTANGNDYLVVNSGTVVLAKNGSFSAVTDLTINSGGTVKMDPANLSTTTQIWAGQVNNTVTINGGTWDLNDTGGVNNRSKHVTGPNGLITNSGTGTGTLVIANRDGAATWTWGGDIQDGPNGGKVAVSFTNGGWSGLQTNNFAGVNTYSGPTSIDQAILQAGSTTALSPNSAYTLTNNVNSRLDLNGNNNTIASLSGGALSQVLLGSGTLTVGNATDTTYSGAISGSGGGIVKNGTGKLTLSGANTYSGDTTVNAGNLLINNSLSGTGNLTVNGGATLLLASGSANGNLTVAGGATPATRGTFSMSNGSAGTLTLGGNATFGNNAGEPSALSFDVGGAASDTLAINGSLVLNQGGASISLTNGGVPVIGTPYTLITFSSGSGAGFATGSGMTVGGLSLAANPFGVGSGSLTVTDTAVQYTASSVAPAPAAAYWSGAQGTTWNALNGAGTLGNFTTDQAGTNFITQYPDGTTDVYFTSTGATNLTNTLGQSFSVKGLTMLNGSAAATISGAGQVLTLGAGGLTAQSGSNGLTLSNSAISLAADQTWTNSSTAPVTVNAAVNGNGGITFAGSGTIALAGANNTYTGNTSINNATVDLANGAISPFGTGTLTLNNSSASTKALITRGGGGNSPTSTNSVTLPNDVVAPAGTVNVIDNSNAFFGNLWITGNWSGTGTVIAQETGINRNAAFLFTQDNLFGFNGTLDLDAPNDAASRTYLFLQDQSLTNAFNAQGTRFILGKVGSLGASTIQWNRGGSDMTVRLGSIEGVQANSVLTPGGATNLTWEIGALNTATTYAGQIIGSSNLSKVGTGTLTLTGTNTYTGATTVNAGTLATAAPNNSSSVAINGGTLKLLGTSALAKPVTISGSAGSWSGKLDLGNASLVVLGADKPSTLAQLADQVNSGKAGGWTGNGITSSSNVAQPNATLAVVDNADLGWTSVGGQSIDATSVFVTRALIGDINLDGNVDLADYDKWYKNVGTGTAHSYAAGDVNLDGNVDLADYDLWYKHVGAAPLTLASQPALGGGVLDVPEPASLAVLAIGSAALLGARRRRK